MGKKQKLICKLSKKIAFHCHLGLCNNKNSRSGIEDENITFKRQNYNELLQLKPNYTI